MARPARRHRWAPITALTAFLWLPAAGAAAPQVQNVSPPGLQAGATTTLTIDGSDLLPAPRVLLGMPVAAQAVRPGATANRVQIDVTLAGDAPPGIHPLRLAHARGVSKPP